MKYLPLIWGALCLRKARTVLTLLSVLVAFLLFGLLDTTRSTFANAGLTVAGRERIMVTPKTGIGSKPLPVSLSAQIKQLPGVNEVEYATYLSGTYQDPKIEFPVEAHSEAFYSKSFYPELDVDPGELKALQSTRAGVLAGETLLKKYGLKVGQKIPLHTQVTRKDGSNVWIFDLVGTLRFTDPNYKVYEEQLFGNWDYVDEASAADTGTVTYYIVKASSASDVDRVARQIDALTANSSHETKSLSEHQWAIAKFQEFADMAPIVTSIMGAVFFTLLLLTGHTMMHAVHERIPELAILKTIGFAGRRILVLVLCESLAPVLLGAMIGLAIATIAVFGVRSVEVLPIRILPLGGAVWMRGLMIAIVIGLVVGILPAMKGMRLRIIDAFSGH